MPTLASIEDLVKVSEELESLKMQSPEMYDKFVQLVKRNKGVGYKNICQLLLGKSPEDLKGEK